MLNICYKPIGIIQTAFSEPKGTPIQHVAASNSKGKIEIFSDYMEGLQDIEGFSHIILIYHMHLVKKKNLKVIPFLDNVEHGCFATRSPSRPNPIGISVVELKSIKENILFISGTDIVNESPLLDIKPFIPTFDCHKAKRIGWLEKFQANVYTMKDDGRFSN